MSVREKRGTCVRHFTHLSISLRFVISHTSNQPEVRHFTHLSISLRFVISHTNNQRGVRHFTHPSISVAFVISHTALPVDNTPPPVDNFARATSFHTPAFVISHTALRHFTHRALKIVVWIQMVAVYNAECNSILTVFNSLYWLEISKKKRVRKTQHFLIKTEGDEYSDEIADRSE